MVSLIDSSVWIDFTRVRSPLALRQFILPFIQDPDAVLAEPVVFEVMRGASDQETRQLTAQFQTLPVLSTPSSLWNDATALGRMCRKAGFTAGAFDLVIAAIAVHHEAALITFDRDFQAIAGVCNLRIKLLRRP
jgi:predicted nucleic acid-binding protein